MFMPRQLNPQNKTKNSQLRPHQRLVLAPQLLAQGNNVGSLKAVDRFRTRFSIDSSLFECDLN